MERGYCGECHCELIEVEGGEEQECIENNYRWSTCHGCNAWLCVNDTIYV